MTDGTFPPLRATGALARITIMARLGDETGELSIASRDNQGKDLDRELARPLIQNDFDVRMLKRNHLSPKQRRISDPHPNRLGKEILLQRITAPNTNTIRAPLARREQTL